jgi:membrane protease YdiL (CAAX protease family)
VAVLNTNVDPAATFLAVAPASLLQVIIFFVAWISCWLPVGVLCAIAVNWRPFTPVKVQQKLPLLASLYLIAPVVLWRLNRITGASFSDYGLTWNLEILRSLGLGFGWGVLSLAILFSIQTVLGWMTWQEVEVGQVVSILLPTLLIALWISGTEELIFRGFLLTQLRHDYSVEIAAITSSLIFALLHLIWEQRETIPQLPGLWLMGIVLVIARFGDHGSLGLAWGLHSGWVWVIASLDTAGIITYTGISPEWLTGKYGKPLAGATGILCLLSTGAILWFYAN